MYFLTKFQNPYRNADQIKVKKSKSRIIAEDFKQKLKNYLVAKYEKGNTQNPPKVSHKHEPELQENIGDEHLRKEGAELRKDSRAAQQAALKKMFPVRPVHISLNQQLFFPNPSSLQNVHFPREEMTLNEVTLQPRWKMTSKCSMLFALLATKQLLVLKGHQVSNHHMYQRT